MWNNEITRQLGIRLPFVGAGMAIVGSAELTAAVSKAGGVGLFCLGPGAPAERVIGDHDRNTLRLRLDPEQSPAGLEPGMTVWMEN
jgi:NAD(P)H-dependent flavin oxidoreductase YrpB (nitropropane dioxygenase family)